MLAIAARASHEVHAGRVEAAHDFLGAHHAEVPLLLILGLPPGRRRVRRGLGCVRRGLDLDLLEGLLVRLLLLRERRETGRRRGSGGSG